MVLILKSWTQAVSFAVYLMLALPTEALPQPKRKNLTNGNTKNRKGAATGGATAGGATAGGAAAAAVEITVATDGSMILDKTVNIG